VYYFGSSKIIGHDLPLSVIMISSNN